MSYGISKTGVFEDHYMDNHRILTSSISTTIANNDEPRIEEEFLEDCSSYNNNLCEEASVEIIRMNSVTL